MNKTEWDKANAMTNGLDIYCKECTIKQAQRDADSEGIVFTQKELDDYLDGAGHGGFASVLIEGGFICDSCGIN
jgi:hypothetical protein